MLSPLAIAYMYCVASSVIGESHHTHINVCFQKQEWGGGGKPSCMAVDPFVFMIFCVCLCVCGPATVGLSNQQAAD